MSAQEIQAKVQELRELSRMKADLEAEITSIQDAIKAQMDAQGVDTITGADYRVTWKEVTGSRLDGKALKAELPEVAARYTIVTNCRRFCVA